MSEDQRRRKVILLLHRLLDQNPRTHPCARSSGAMGEAALAAAGN